MLKNTNNQGEILDIENILRKYKENIVVIQQSLKKFEQAITKLQSEGLVGVEKLANEFSMLQKLSSNIEYKAKCLVCNNSETIETSIPK